MVNEGKGQPVLDPVLKFIRTPVQETASGGGKSRDDIVEERLAPQRAKLSRQLIDIKSRISLNQTSEGYIPLMIKMFEDSLAPTKTPTDLFSKLNSSPLIAPYKNGYLAELYYSQIDNLINAIKTKNDVKSCVDISRVSDISLIEKENVLGNRNIDELWDEAPTTILEGKSRKTFIAWFIPFSDKNVRQRNIEAAARSIHAHGISPKQVTQESDEEIELITLPDQRAEYPITIYQNEKVTRLNVAERMIAPVYSVAIEKKEELEALAASGKVTRINPPRALSSTIVGSESSSDPGPLPLNIDNAPIVGVIDGGRTASSFDKAEAWRINPELVSTSIADTRHGNRVTSLIVNGHEWNKNLSLPPLFCRVGTVQVLTKKEHKDKAPELPAVVKYIGQAMADHPETKIWNFSVNQECECDHYEVSELGHAITQLARKHNVLPVISAGNRDGIETKISPPADSEAALVCGGRKHDDDGNVSSACDQSRLGFGPDGMLKPDLSWYSTVRVIGGGDPVTGTSYAAPLVAKVAAHTWERMTAPSPDLVKALIINQGDLSQYDPALGWGSPILNDHPWECPQGSACMAWVSELKPGLEHYWHDIVLPETMFTADGFLKGTISLTAILNPVFLNMAGVGNYFMTRLEVSLQHKNGKDKDGKDKWDNVLGSDSLPKSEVRARAEEYKWQPVRRHIKSFTRTTIGNRNLRLRARIYVRDEWQLGLAKSDFPDLEVAFVLGFKDATGNPNTYNSFVSAMRQHVESAVIGQNIDIDAEE